MAYVWGTYISHLLEHYGNPSCTFPFLALYLWMQYMFLIM